MGEEFLLRRGGFYGDGGFGLPEMPGLLGGPGPPVQHQGRISFCQAGIGKDQALSFFGDEGSWLVGRSAEQPQGRSGQGCALPAEEGTPWGDPRIISFGQAGAGKDQAPAFLAMGAPGW